MWIKGQLSQYKPPHDVHVVRVDLWLIDLLTVFKASDSITVGRARVDTGFDCK